MADQGDNQRDVHRPAAWRCNALALIIGPLPLAAVDVPAVQAQGMMRSPSINISSRVPTISNNVGRINPAVGGRANIAGSVGRTTPGITARVTPTVSVGSGARIGVVTPKLPYARLSHNSYPACDYVNRSASGECVDRQVSVDDGGAGGPAKRSRGQTSSPPRDKPQAGLSTRYVANEILAEVEEAQADDLARRHRLVRIETLNLSLPRTTLGLFRITDGRSVEAVRTALAADASVHSVQPNFFFVLQQQKSATVPREGDPAQYALTKLRLPQAHTLAHGSNVTIAVIDSGIDATHPELADSIGDTYDALGSKEGPDVHGTGIAGAIVAHARLMGSAPQARILAIRAFGRAQSGAQGTSVVVLKSLDYAAAHGAQIVNMSFVGPRDPLLERAVAAAAAKGIVLVAASGNAGAKSPPLYPAANPNVIAVSATDAADKLFAASNRGAHIALAAPGVEIFLPAPDGKYQMTSGTSFSAAYVSGLAALVLERNPALKPEEVRAVLTRTARDLGAPGRDDLFGSGVADAYAAVTAAEPSSVPVAASPVVPAAPAEAKKASTEQVLPSTRALEQAGAAMPSDRPAPH
jgi:subtilisin family serine protease